MANNNADRWYFTKEQLEETPSRKAGYDAIKELSYRQQTANFIQDMGQRLKVSQLCINTAIVYMHRFYVFHSFSHFPWHQMAAAALFLAAKVEEQPRKLEYVIRVANMCRNTKDVDLNSERYLAQSQDLVFNENVLLQTLGFDVVIDHPHTHVVRCCHLVRASKDLAQSSYFLASNSLHLTTMCLQYKPTVVACFCIHLACKWSSWEIPLSSERKEWFLYVDPTVTSELLQQLTDEFLTIYESCPSRHKEKIMAITANGMYSTSSMLPSTLFETDPKKITNSDQKDGHSHRPHESKSASGVEGDLHKHRTSRPFDGASSSSGLPIVPSTLQQREREYREKKEREKMAQHGLKLPQPSGGQPQQPPPKPHSNHHRPPIDPLKLKPHSRQPSSSSSSASSSGGAASSGPHPTRAEPRDILREASSRDSPFGIAAKDLREKETSKRGDYLLKPNVAAEASANNASFGEARYNGDKSRPSSDQGRPLARPIDQKQPSSGRRVDETRPYVKPPTTASSSSSSSLTAAGVAPAKPTSAASQRSDQSNKSVPRSTTRPHHHNGSGPEVITTEMPTKRPSLFSPEKSPEPAPQPPPALSRPELGLAPPPEFRRGRNSSGSEPELRPVMKKIDQVEGFENLLRDSTIGVNKLHKVPDIITPIVDDKKLDDIKYSKEMKPPDIIKPLSSDTNISASGPLVNGIETDPALISSLLKEAPPVSHLTTVATIVSTTTAAGSSNNTNLMTPSQPPSSSSITDDSSKEHHHKSKKKNKEKHKHKDKDKEKSREDKEKKKKHKDKDREKHKHKDRDKHEISNQATTIMTGEPIKIKIHKDKIQPIQSAMPLKIKIPKDVIKTDVGEGPMSQPPPPLGLKIKIPKEKLTTATSSNSSNMNNNSSGGSSGVNFNTSNGGAGEAGSSSRKRERDRDRDHEPPAKLARAHKESSSKQNGRHSYNKVTQMVGDGDTSIHRLAESKYINKNSSS